MAEQKTNIITFTYGYKFGLLEIYSNTRKERTTTQKTYNFVYRIFCAKKD